jgi:hypothetical protein
MATALAQPPNPFLMEVQSIENDLAATQYAAKLQREQEAHNALMRDQEVKQAEARRTERVTTTVLQCVTPIGGGALSTLTWGRVPVGAILNSLVGTAGAIVTYRDSERPAVRVVGQSIQTLLHNQIAITTRDILRGMP